jgi:hypothetical protein
MVSQNKVSLAPIRMEPFPGSLPLYDKKISPIYLRVRNLKATSNRFIATKLAFALSLHAIALISMLLL